MKTLSKPSFAVNSACDYYLTSVITETVGKVGDDEKSFYSKIHSNVLGFFDIEIKLSESAFILRKLSSRDFYVIQSSFSVEGVSVPLFRVIIPFIKLTVSEAKILWDCGILHQANLHKI